jgi:hypothetical protein
MFNHFRCEICGKLRPNSFISVNKLDLGEKLKLPAGTYGRNINYCNDKKECIDGAVKKGETELCSE